MAQAKVAKVKECLRLTEQSQLVYLELTPNTPFEYEGGKYVIVNSQVILANGKPAKRAYSIVKKVGNTILLSALKLNEGPGSNYLDSLKPGDEVEFSGPWGKLTPQLDQKCHDIIATDTGITAALGLANDSRYLDDDVSVSLVWIRGKNYDFLSDNFVRESLPSHVDCNIIEYPDEEDIDKENVFRTLIRDYRKSKEQQFYLVGDGAKVLPIKDALECTGVLTQNISLEIFFNKPDKALDMKK